jgi:small subunit ribosomal protein S20
MANIASQKKRIQRTERERIENRRLTSAVRTHFRRLQQATRSGDADAAEAEHRRLVSRIDKAVQKGALHARNGARKKSRAARLRGGSQPPP